MTASLCPYCFVALEPAGFALQCPQCSRSWDTGGGKPRIAMSECSMNRQRIMKEKEMSTTQPGTPGTPQPPSPSPTPPTPSPSPPRPTGPTQP